MSCKSGSVFYLSNQPHFSHYSIFNILLELTTFCSISFTAKTTKKRSETLTMRNQSDSSQNDTGQAISKSHIPHGIQRLTWSNKLIQSIPSYNPGLSVRHSLFFTAFPRLNMQESSPLQQHLLPVNLTQSTKSAKTDQTRFPPAVDTVHQRHQTPQCDILYNDGLKENDSKTQQNT